MTAGEGPGNGWAVHDCGYVPLLTGGRLVKRHDPAWQLPEVGNGRDAETLQRFVDARAAHDLLHKQPGYGLGYHHSRDPRGEVAGYPDVHVWAPRGQMFRELKRMGERPRPDQVATLTALHAAGADVGVWWPCCWYAGRIDRELAALAGKTPIGQHWAPGLPPQPGQPGYVPWKPDQPPPRPRRPRGRADQVAPRTAAGRRPPAEMPGAAMPAGFAGEHAVGYVVPMPASERAAAAVVDLERWLRGYGFPPVAVPYPVRLVVTHAGVAVQCRTGGPGAPRVWRHAPLRHGEAPPVLAADRLNADVIRGRGEFVLDLIGDAAPSRNLTAA